LFSGIVTAVGEIESIPQALPGVLVIAHPSGWGALRVDDSLAVNGCCLTVVSRELGRVAVEVMPETLRRTTLGALASGDRVNLEAALALGAPVGGHLVSGHVDATGEVLAVEPEQNAVWLTLRVPASVGRYCVPQGSIAVDGCSLTLVSVEDRGTETTARVSLIPHTMASTVASGYLPGTMVNVEADSMAKLVERLVAPHLVGSAAWSRTRPGSAAGAE
jgi:riboflavin synthase